MARGPGKYTPELLVTMFRKAAALRNEMVEAGFTDNGGAIHSASRILDLLGQRLKYPGLSHINGLRNYATAEFSEADLNRYEEGGSIFIEHVSPLRALTAATIALVEAGANDVEVLDYLRNTYRLVLLTAEETAELNQTNRSRLDGARVAHLHIVTRA